MVTAQVESEAYRRILDTAYDLFYSQGYKATGINQVIAESGVAKATFYSHFPSKESLGVAYIRERNHREISELRRMIDQWRTPRERFLAPMAMLVQWLEDTGYRGCPFQNIVIEFEEPGHPVHQEVSRNRDEYIQIFRERTQELKDSGVAYADLEVERMAQTYMILVEGAVMLAVIRHDPQPVRDALQALIRLID